MEQSSSNANGHKETAAKAIRQRYPKHMSGMTLVDAYYINDEDLVNYVTDRDRYIALAIELLKPYFKTVQMEFSDSQDGEALTAITSTDEWRFLFHLDPLFVDGMREAERMGTLSETVLSWADLNPKQKNDV
ncbi:MAG: hypothetical protein Q4A67_05525 [Aerococcus sp.]|nr:hypothetical protein [Aerococcus sp.]